MRYIFVSLSIYSITLFACPSVNTLVEVQETQVQDKVKDAWVNVRQNIQPFMKFEDLPGGPGGVRNAKIDQGLYLSTFMLNSRLFPEVRQKDPLVPLKELAKGSFYEVEKPENVPILPPGDVKLFDVVLVSKSHSGSTSVVKLGMVKGEKIISVKFIVAEDFNDPVENLKAVREEAAMASVISDLGIGPKFYGLVHRNGKFGIATDMVPGDFAETFSKDKISLKTLMSLENVLERLGKMKYAGEEKYPNLLGDMNLFMTSEGEVLLIDPHFLVDHYKSEPPKSIDNASAFFPHERFSYFKRSADDAQIEYLKYLKEKKPEAYEALLLELKKQGE